MTTDPANTKADFTTLKKLHRVGIKGILEILFDHKTFKKWPIIISFFISLACCVLLEFQKVNSLFILQVTVNLITTVFPGLLGFSLGGYALVVGFTNTGLIKQSTETRRYNIYQKLSAIFSLSILIQAITTITGALIAWCINTKIGSVVNIFSSVANQLNFSLLFFLIFAAIYSLLLIPYIVTNLFTLSQINSLFYTLEKIQEEKENNNRGKSDCRRTEG